MADHSQLPPDFYDPVPFANHRSSILGICIPLMTICWMAIGARLFTRLFIARTPGWDDFFVVAAALTVSMGTVAFMVSTNYGMGQHIYLLEPQNISKIVLCNYLFGAAYNCSTALIKISLLLQYLRVFERGTWTYRCAQLLLVVISLWGFSFGFIAWFSCLPDPSALWKGTGKGCYGAASANMDMVVRVIEAHAGMNFAFDILILMLAFRLLSAKEVQTTKVGMLVLIFVGSISCMFAAWRLASIVETNAGRSNDLSWGLPGATLLSICEIYIAVLVASIPFFWPMIKEQISKIFVMYEFSVSTESRFHRQDEGDEGNELSGLQSGHLGSMGGTEDLKSLGSKSGDYHFYQDLPDKHYAVDHFRPQPDPFSGEFQTDTVSHNKMSGKNNDNPVQFQY